MIKARVIARAFILSKNVFCKPYLYSLRNYKNLRVIYNFYKCWEYGF